MIVKDKEKSIKFAGNVADKVISLITKECQSFDASDDPAEYIYLLSHIQARVNATLLVSCEVYGEIYGIKGVTCKALKRWIGEITMEWCAIHMIKENKQFASFVYDNGDKEVVEIIYLDGKGKAWVKWKNELINMIDSSSLEPLEKD